MIVFRWKGISVSPLTFVGVANGTSWYLYIPHEKVYETSLLLILSSQPNPPTNVILALLVEAIRDHQSSTLVHDEKPKPVVNLPIPYRRGDPHTRLLRWVIWVQPWRILVTRLAENSRHARVLHNDSTESNHMVCSVLCAEIFTFADAINLAILLCHDFLPGTKLLGIKH